MEGSRVTGDAQVPDPVSLNVEDRALVKGESAKTVAATYPYLEADTLAGEVVT